MKLINIRKLVISSIMGAFLLVGSAVVGNAQNLTREYQQWQRAEQRAQHEQRQYMRTRSQRDYWDWQKALQRAQRERMQYQNAVARANNRGSYNTGYAASNRNMYRVNRGGRVVYTTDQRGVELLRAAVNHGYNQGYREGQIARQYRRPYGYQNVPTYRHGTYGYQSHVARDQYQHYFQQGFQRGFEDGYHSTNRYGQGSGTAVSILGGVLNTILNIAQQ